MNPGPRDTLLFDIDPVCEQFEQACRQSCPPRIEEFLGDWSGDRRRVLFQALLDIELYYLEESGGVPDLEDYRRRFPDYDAVITRTQLSRSGEAPPPEQGLVPGSRFGDTTIVREIGRGGMGIVYEARHEVLDRPVALKVLPHMGAQHRVARERFQQEARAVARLHHTNIVPIFEVGEVDGTPFYSMQLIDGRPLDAVIRDAASDAGARSPSSGALLDRARDAARISLQIARALQYAHAQGVVHRDVKPSNILVDRDGVAWLVDFGLAKLDDSDMTTSRDLLGTIRYMPPERFGGVADGRGDLYSLGLTLFELAALRPAFRADDQARLMRDILADRGESLDRLEPRLPRDLRTIAATATEFRPADRYASAEELALDLERFLADRPIEAREVSPPERLLRWARRNRAATAALLLLATTAAVATFAAIELQAQKREITRQKADISALATNERHLRIEAQTTRDELRGALYRADMQRACDEATSVAGGARLAGLLERWIPRPGEPDLRGWEWSLLRSFCIGAVGSVRDRDLAGSGLDLSPDGRRVVTTGSHGAAIWNAETLELERRLVTDYYARAVEWSPDGRHIALSDWKRTRVYSADSGELLAVHPSEAGRLGTWHPDGTRILVTTNAAPVLWSWHEPGIPDQSLAEGGEGLYPCFSPDGRWLASTMRRGVGALETEDWTIARRFPLGRMVGDTHFDPQGRRIVAADRTHTIHVLDVESGESLCRIEAAHAETINTVRWCPRGRYLVSASADSSVKIWDAEHGGLVRRLLGHEGNVMEAVFGPDGQVFSTSFDGTLRAWDNTPIPAQTILGSQAAGGAALDGLHWLPDGRLSVGRKGGPQIWDVEAWPPRLERRDPAVEISRSPDGRIVLRRDGDDLCVHDGETDALRVRLPIAEFPVAEHHLCTAQWSPDSQRVYLCSRVALHVCEGFPDAPRARRLTEDLERGYYRSDLSPDGRRLAVQDGQLGRVRILDAGTGEEQSRFELGECEREDSRALATPSWSPDQRLLAVTDGSRLRIYDPDSGQRIAAHHHHSDRITAAAWSPDGRRIVTCGWDQRVQIFDPENGLTMTLSCPEPLVDVIWSPDGTRLFAQERSGLLHVWDARSALEEERP